MNALERKWISAAYLDVFDKEPLPATNPLWEMDNVTITPHISGPSPLVDVAKSFGDNLLRYVEGKPLNRVFDWQRQY